MDINSSFNICQAKKGKKKPLDSGVRANGSESL